METGEGYDATVWRRMASELGLQGLAGRPSAWVELGLVFEEMGRALVGAPFLGTVVAAEALLACGEGDRYMPDIASGDLVATLAVVEDVGRWDATGVACRASETASDGWRLDGHKSYVLDGCVAGLVLVAARTDDGAVRLFAVDGGFVATPLSTLDLTRKLARIQFSGTPARLIGDWAAVERALALGAVALAAEQLGGAQRCLEMALEHAKERRQFGRPIGGFQAIKHRFTELLRHVESARSTAGYAAMAAAEDDPGELLMAASLAKAACSEAYLHVAAENIQLHGAVGFTWDHDAHLYFKRAKSSALLFGDATYHRSLLADRLGL